MKYILMAKKNKFSSSAQRFVNTNRFYIYESKEKALAVKRELLKDPTVVETILFKEDVDD